MSPTNRDDDELTWGSSEFESYDEDENSEEGRKDPPNGTQAVDATHEIYSKAEIKMRTPEVRIR